MLACQIIVWYTRYLINYTVDDFFIIGIKLARYNELMTSRYAHVLSHVDKARLAVFVLS